MAGFLFRLETPEGRPAAPPTFSAAVGDCLHFSDRTLLVVDQRDDDVEQLPVLVVEDTAA